MIDAGPLQPMNVWVALVASTSSLRTLTGFIATFLRILVKTRSLVLRNLHGQADSHEEACERLRKVFQVGRPQPPAIPLLAGVIGEISDRKTVNLPEIDDQGQPIILGILG